MLLISDSIQFQQQFYIVAVDSSLKRPGFAVFHINDNKIQSISLSSVDNKTNIKPHGQLLDQIIVHFDSIIPSTDKHIYFVRQHTAPNPSKSFGTQLYVFQTVGMLNHYVWLFKSKLNEQTQWYQVYPTSVKKLITGSGKAKKPQVAKCLDYYVGELNYENDDQSDAVAVGVAFMIQNNLIKQREIEVQGNAN